MINIIKKSECTGCNACSNICPTNCISAGMDNDGFYYPEVVIEKCIACKKCLDTCPIMHPARTAENSVKPTVYAAWSLDDFTRYTSTSGGIFSEFAKYILAKKGSVAGAYYNKEHLVEHGVIDNFEAIEKLRQSKYIQSDIGLTFREIKNRLQHDKLVAFCGSPCQVAGLLNYLGKKHDKLITFDFVCRGANSPKVYLKYLKMLEKKYDSKINKVWFKNKTYGWNRFSTKIDFENGQEYIQDRNNDLFMKGYFHNLYIRSSCFQCQYKSFPRISDITLADFWGISKYDKSIDDFNGVSLIMINSAIGNNLFNGIKNVVFSKEQPLEIAIKGNGCILQSVKPTPQREKFLKKVDQLSFDECIHRFSKPPLYYKILTFLLQIGSRLKRAVIKIRLLAYTFSSEGSSNKNTQNCNQKFRC